MAQTGISIASVLEKLREFDRLAARLSMPRGERLNILNLPDHAYRGLQQGNLASFEAVTPSLDRRLSYALPLMRKLSQSAPPIRSVSATNAHRLCAA